MTKNVFKVICADHTDLFLSPGVYVAMEHQYCSLMKNMQSGLIR